MTGRRAAPFVLAAIIGGTTPAVAVTATSPLAAAARSLVPAGPSFVVREAIRERDCPVGSASLVRCVRFNIESSGLRARPRRRVLVANAQRHGWTVVRVRLYRDASAFVYLARGGLRATLGVGGDSLGPRVPTWVQVTRPSSRRSVRPPASALRSRVSAAARRPFVRAANARCVAAVARIRRIPRGTRPLAAIRTLRSELDRAIRSIDRLPPPRGDDRAVRSLLASFRRFSHAIGDLVTVKGEEALGAAAEVAVTGRRARAAATSYGLDACLPLFG